MECNKLFKEALDNIGIESTYKLDDTLKSLNPKQKFSAPQLEGFLKKKGVSPKELKQSGIFNDIEDRPKLVSEWLDRISDGKHHISKVTKENVANRYETEFNDITLGGKGIDNSSYS